MNRRKRLSSSPQVHGRQLRLAFFGPGVFEVKSKTPAVLGDREQDYDVLTGLAHHG